VHFELFFSVSFFFSRFFFFSNWLYTCTEKKSFHVHNKAVVDQYNAIEAVDPQIRFYRNKYSVNEPSSDHLSEILSSCLF